VRVRVLPEFPGSPRPGREVSRRAARRRLAAVRPPDAAGDLHVRRTLGSAQPVESALLGPNIVIHAAITTFIAPRTITWRQALLGFPCDWIANWWNKAIYFWTFIREWILERHYVSWTARQGRATVISQMSGTRRRVIVASIAIVAPSRRWPSRSIERTPRRARG
jgi:hypothetical protein